MEISRILIKNFKGIEKAEIEPVKPINVLIGRNNSGKSSLLTCLEFLNKYFKALEPGDRRVQAASSISVPSECFRAGLRHPQEFVLAITVAESTEERKRQFSEAVAAWNGKHRTPRVAPASVDAQLENDLFSTLTFEFLAKPPNGPFGLVSIFTVCEDGEGNRANVAVAASQQPGGTMARLHLRELFMPPPQPRNIYRSVWELSQQVGFDNRLKVDYQRGGFSAVDETFFQHLIVPAFDHVKKAFSSAFLVSPYRHGRQKDTAILSTELRTDGSNLVEYMLNLALNKHDIFENVAAFVRSIVPEVGRLHPRFTGMQDNSLELAYDWPDGRTVNLVNMGGGVEQLLILGCLLIHQRTSCILWEEPESHLHPGAQDILLNELDKRAGDSLIFLSTQSPVFIRPSDKITVHAFRNRDGKSATVRTLSKDQLQEAATVVGSRPGHLAQADIVLYVEGKTGAAAVKEWLHKWPKRDQVLGYLQLEVQSVNVDEVATEETLLSALKKVNPNLIIFVDRENEPGETKPKVSRTTLTTKCKKIGIPCIITETRQIEDYFTYEAVQNGLPTNLWRNFERAYDASKTIGAQFHRGWKLHNYRIAAAMHWKDVEQRKGIQRLLE